MVAMTLEYIVVLMESLLVSLPLPMLAHRAVLLCRIGKPVLPRFSVFASSVAADCDSTVESRRHDTTPAIAQQQREIARERASVMVLQMRPHFIYNTLMSIYSLCLFDPQKARQITMDFTNYLRKNFNAIASDSAIPFSTELEHTRAYLAVEQAQFGNMLIVEYDTPFTRFRLPPLTLQPIVENAVKHNMDLDSGPLSISIRSLCTEFGIEIIVEDNGSGFDPSDECKQHITLTKQRGRQ